MAIEASEGPPGIALSWDEFLARDEERAEYVDGMLVVTPRGTYEHQTATRRLANLLEAAGHISVSEWAWRPEERREYQPDVMVLDERPVGRNWTASPPLLVVEVTSPSNAVKDWVRNLHDYARFGAGSYWVLDHGDGCLCCFDLVDGAYRPVAQGTDVVEVPGWGSVDVARLWA